MLAWDIIAAALIMGGIALLIAIRIQSAVRHHRPLATTALILLVVAAFILQVRLAHSLLWAKYFPDPDVLIWCNLTPMFLAVATGLAMHRRNQMQASRWLVPALSLMTLATWSAPFMLPIVKPLQGMGAAEWSDGVCLQTHRSSCAPAAAATLLRQHGLLYTEGQMADLCLSADYGTTGLGLYRGLSLATEGSGLEVQVFSGDLTRFQHQSFYPAIALVTLPSESGPWREQFATIAGRKPGEGHAIVVFGPTDATHRSWEVGDPAGGRYVWRSAELEDVWSGEAIRLTR